MRALRPCLLALLAASALDAHAQVCVPGSASPDRRTALYYLSHPSAAEGRKFEFYFLRSKSLSRLSGQLVPDVSGRVLGEDPTTTDDFDNEILFEDIGHDVDSVQSGVQRDPAFSYYIAWSSDSRWVSVEGGAHKFWHWMVYHLVDGRFQQVALPDYEFVDYYHDHLPHLHVPRRGVEGIIVHRSYDYPCVCWLGNGIAAVDARPYLLREDSYSDGSVPHPDRTFFSLDCRAKPRAKILGFCQ